MGGVLVIGAVFLSSLFWARPDNRFVWLALFSMVYLGRPRIRGRLFEGHQEEIRWDAVG